MVSEQPTTPLRGDRENIMTTTITAALIAAAAAVGSQALLTFVTLITNRRHERTTTIDHTLRRSEDAMVNLRWAVDTAADATSPTKRAAATAMIAALATSPALPEADRRIAAAVLAAIPDDAQQDG